MTKDEKKAAQQRMDQEYAVLYLLQQQLEPVENLMKAQGIMFQMLIEVVTFEKNKGVTEKSKASRQRVLDLMEIFEGFSLMYDQLTIGKQYMTRLLNRIAELETERDQLKQTVEATEKAWKEA